MPLTRIIVTSDLDEWQLAALASAPVDGYGVGTSLVTGSGHPTCGFVYKLVAREDATGELVSVAKKSTDKQSIGGRKYALRRLGPDGRAQAEVIGIGESPGDYLDDQLKSWMVHYEQVGSVTDLQQMTDAVRRVLANIVSYMAFDDHEITDDWNVNEDWRSTVVKFSAGRRFFANDLNGPLYILDKQSKRFTTYLDFNGLGAQGDPRGADAAYPVTYPFEGLGGVRVGRVSIRGAHEPHLPRPAGPWGRSVRLGCAGASRAK